jgi:hypothetical protein
VEEKVVVVVVAVVGAVKVAAEEVEKEHPNLPNKHPLH